MRSARHRIAGLVAAAVLALPAAAWGQSAGDDQYQDPFGGGSGQGGGGGGGDSSQDEPEAPAPAAPAPEAAPAPAPTAAPAQTDQASSQEQLPRTGADAGLLALGGTVLLASGVALRVRVSEPARRRRRTAARA